jgi:hypothetical protein
VTVSWSPECTFIVDVDAQEKEEKDG